MTETDSTLSREEADQLVLENHGWAESIARSVARSWNLDWRLDGLDGAAMEALIFCARRFNPSRGIPFRGYARRRIHEAASDAARKSRGWRRSSSSMSPSEVKSREISVQLFEVFPELRDGELSSSSDDGGGGEGSMRSAIRELLVGASLLASREIISEGASPEELVDYRRMVRLLSTLDPVHQLIMWKVYWEGMSLRGVAEEWETDGLNVIREHKALLAFLHKSLAQSKQQLQKPKVRPGLRPLATKEMEKPPFSALIDDFGKLERSG